MLLADMGGTPYGKSLNFLQFSVLPTVPWHSLGPGIALVFLDLCQSHPKSIISVVSLAYMLPSKDPIHKNNL